MGGGDDNYGICCDDGAGDGVCDGGALLPSSVVPMGMWLVWWRAEILGMGKSIAGGYPVDDMVVMMMVVEMA